MSYTIRALQPEDIPVLSAIQIASWRAAFQGILSDEALARCTDYDNTMAFYRHIFDQNIGHGYVGEIDGKPHCIAFWDRSKEKDMEECAEILCFHSLPDNWGCGYAGKMMDYIIAEIANAGYSKIMLLVFCENIRARTFCERKGFCPIDKYKITLDAPEIYYVREC